MKKLAIFIVPFLFFLVLVEAQSGFIIIVSNVEKPSVHEGTNVIVTTDLATLTLYNVESEPGKITTGFVEGNEILAIVVEPGPSGLHSIDIETDIRVLTPTPTNTLEPTATPTVTEEPTSTPTVSKPVVTETVTVTATITPTATVTVTLTIEPTATATNEPTVTPTTVITMTTPPLPSVTPTEGVTSTPPPRPTLTPTARNTKEPIATEECCEEMLAQTGGAGGSFAVLLVAGISLIGLGVSLRRKHG